jgi:hypothetical protein
LKERVIYGIYVIPNISNVFNSLYSVGLGSEGVLYIPAGRSRILKYYPNNAEVYHKGC